MSISHIEILYNFYMKINLRLKELRNEHNLTQKQIAEKLHIKQNTYSQYENGDRQVPLEIVIMLSKFYGVSTDYLLGLE